MIGCYEAQRLNLFSSIIRNFGDLGEVEVLWHIVWRDDRFSQFSANAHETNSWRKVRSFSQ